MKKNMFIIILVLFTVSIVFAGGRQEKGQGSEVHSDQEISNEELQSNVSEFRTVTDLMGNKVKLPTADKLKRIVIIAPPLVATFASLDIPGAEIVGAHKTAFFDANHDLLNIILPYWQDIPTGFLTGFASNSEELLKLKPDVILVYGKFQQEGLQGLGIPVLDFFIKNKDNEVWSVSIEALMREIFEIDNDIPTLQLEWDLAKKRMNRKLFDAEGEKRKGLMIMTNTGDKITVRGAGSYGEDWLLKSGLTNAAADIEGDNIEVTMEQIYEWDPDIIYVFRGKPASEYLSGSLKKQNWSYVTAFKSRNIYDTPRGLMNWGAPNVDSPLMLQWMVSKNYPGSLSDTEFLDIMKNYYQDRYGIEMTEELLVATLYPNGR